MGSIPGSPKDYMAKLNSINPANGRVVGSVKISTKNEVINAFKKAKKIFPVWKRIPIEKRIGYIDKFAKEIQSGQKIVEILKKVGLPEGVVNVVFGSGRVGKMVVDSPVNFTCFTGSSKVGQEIYQKCGKKFIRSVLELGGSSPALVFADVDLDNAIENIYWARFSNCGQVCCAVKRLFVEKKFQPFLERMVEKISQKKIGDPFFDVDFGPLVSKKQLDLLVSQVKDAIQKGAKVEIGGKRPKGREYQKGNFFLPTILTNVNFKSSSSEDGEEQNALRLHL